MHYQGCASVTHTVEGLDWTDGWHTIGVEWAPGLLIWYADGAEVRRVADSRVVGSRSYLLLSIASGGWAGEPDGATPLPADFQVDYVRVWQR